MLKINLLPESVRKTSLSRIEQLHRMPLTWIACGLMVAFALSLLAPILFQRRQLRELNIKIQELQPKKEAVEKIQRYVQELRKQEDAFRGLKQASGLWSKRLNTLSDVTPDGVWFTDLMLDQEKGLVIQGSAIGPSGSEMVSVGRLVQDLKDSPDFTAAIKDIQIESIKRIQDREIEIVQFTLSCTLAGAPPPAKPK